MNRSEIRYRRCRRRDLYPAVRLILRAVGELRRRTGKPPIPWRPRSAPAAFEHLRRTDPETFLCAWSGERLVGFTGALVRGNQWYLAYLFVEPRLQAQGVGRELLRRVWREGPGVTHALGTFTYNQHAVGLYTSFGMVPQQLITLMEAKTDRIRLPTRKALDVSSDCTKEDVDWVTRLEGRIRGYRRAEEWGFWMRSDEYRLQILRRRGRRVGYSLFGPRGDIAPLGVASPDDLLEAISASVRAAAEGGAETVRFFCPNVNREAYRHLNGLGFRNLEMLLFMADKPYGDFSRYVPATLAVF